MWRFLLRMTSLGMWAAGGVKLRRSCTSILFLAAEQLPQQQCRLMSGERVLCNTQEGLVLRFVVFFQAGNIADCLATDPSAGS